MCTPVLCACSWCPSNKHRWPLDVAQGSPELSSGLGSTGRWTLKAEASGFRLCWNTRYASCGAELVLKGPRRVLFHSKGRDVQSRARPAPLRPLWARCSQRQSQKGWLASMWVHCKIYSSTGRQVNSGLQLIDHGQVWLPPLSRE